MNRFRWPSAPDRDKLDMAAWFNDNAGIDGGHLAQVVSGFCSLLEGHVSRLPAVMPSSRNAAP